MFLRLVQTKLGLNLFKIAYFFYLMLAISTIFLFKEQKIFFNLQTTRFSSRN